MRIDRLELRAFGPFTDLELDLSQGDFGLHVVYGPNEAGKSSALRALRQLLFGIESRTTDNFLHSYPSLRIGAMLRNLDDQTLRVIRRKGTKDTLRGPDDRKIVDPTELNVLLGGIDETQFSKRFGIDHQELVSGGREIVRGGGEMGNILFSTGGGMSNLNDLRETLVEQAESLFKPSGKNPTLNAAIKELNTARSDRKKALLRHTDWTEHRKALDQAEQDRSELEQQLVEKTAELSRYERFFQVIPLIDKRRHLLEQLGELRTAPVLSEDFTVSRRDIESGLTGAKAVRDETQQQLAEIESDLKQLEVDPLLLANEAAIKTLRNPLGAIQKAASDRPGLVSQRDQLQRDARKMLSDLGRESKEDDLGGMALDLKRRKEIQRLGNQREGLLARSEDTSRALAKLRDEIKNLSSQLHESSVSKDTADLRRFLKRSAGQIDLEKRASQLQEEADNTEAESQRVLERLGSWTGPLDNCETLPIPVTDTIERFETQWRDSEQHEQTVKDNLRKTEGEISQLQAKIEELRQTQDALSEEDLKSQRERRDRGWQFVLADWQDADTDRSAVEAFIAELPPAKDLAQAFQISIERADEAADRMRREADQVARKAQLMSQLQKAESQLDELHRLAKSAEQSRVACRQEWNELWAPLGIEPLPPREMRTWVGRFEALRQRVEGTRELRQQAEDLIGQAAKTRKQLLATLEEFDASEIDAGAANSLRQLMEAAEEMADRHDAARAEQDQVRRDLNARNKQLGEAERASLQASERFDQWQTSWSKAMKWLELDAETHPDDAQSVVNALNELSKKWHDSDDRAQRIAAIDDDFGRFKLQVSAVCERVAPDLKDQAPDIAAETLLNRLDESNKAKGRMEGLEERRAAEEKRQRDANTRIESLTKQLVSMCQEAGCETADGLPEIEQRSVRRRDAESKLSDIEERILDFAAGTPLEELIEEVSEIDADQLEPIIQQSREALEDLQRRKDELIRTVERERIELDRMGTGDAAAVADEQVHSLLTRIRDEAEEYARLRLASAVLRRAIDRYREKNQDPVLRRASEVFAELTLGSFGGLQEDNDNSGQSILVGVRGDGRSIVNVEGMSEGTRDQLYLALRLASLERFLEQAAPLPFIIDDVLVQFDDTRSTAALKTLADLSDRTQILFFTHHEHLIDLAQQHLPEGKLFVHRLPVNTARDDDK